jgi:hypothetical protein
MAASEEGGVDSDEGGGDRGGAGDDILYQHSVYIDWMTCAVHGRMTLRTVSPVGGKVDWSLSAQLEQGFEGVSVEDFSVEDLSAVPSDASVDALGVSLDPLVGREGTYRVSGLEDMLVMRGVGVAAEQARALAATRAMAQREAAAKGVAMAHQNHNEPTAEALVSEARANASVARRMARDAFPLRLLADSVGTSSANGIRPTSPASARVLADDAGTGSAGDTATAGAAGAAAESGLWEAVRARVHVATADLQPMLGWEARELCKPGPLLALESPPVSTSTNMARDRELGLARRRRLMRRRRTGEWAPSAVSVVEEVSGLQVQPVHTVLDPYIACLALTYCRHFLHLNPIHHISCIRWIPLLQHRHRRWIREPTRAPWSSYGALMPLRGL